MRKYASKILICLLLLLLLSGMAAASVFAQTTDKVESETWPEYDYNFDQFTTSEVGRFGTEGLHNKSEVFYYKAVNNELAYCLDFGKRYRTTSEYTRVAQTDWDNFGEEKQILLMLILKYGYSGSTAGHSSHHVEYYATQVAVWCAIYDEFDGPHETKILNEFFKTGSEGAQSKYANARAYYNQIKAGVNAEWEGRNIGVLPSFTVPTKEAVKTYHEMKYDPATISGKQYLYSVTLTDTKGVLSSLESGDETFWRRGTSWLEQEGLADYVYVKINDDNTLTVRTTKAYKDGIVLRIGQEMKFDFAEAYWVPTEVQVGTPASHQNVISLRTGFNYRYIFGFFGVKAEEVGGFGIQKATNDGDTSNGILDVTFKITDTSDNPIDLTGHVKTGTIVSASAGTIRTNASGYVELEGLSLGQYKVSEVEGTQHFTYGTASSQTVTVTANSTGETLKLTFTNILTHGDFKIKKTTDVDEFPEPAKTYEKITPPAQELSVEFQIKKPDGTPLVLSAVPGTENYVQIGRIVNASQGIVMSDRNGDVWIRYVKFGTYTITERQSTMPDNFIVDITNPRTITVVHNSKVNPPVVTFKNRLIYGYIELYKGLKDAETNIATPLAGVQFYIINQHDESKVYGPYVTNESGYLKSDKIPYGDYWVREVTPPENQPNPDYEIKIREYGKTYRIGGDCGVIINDEYFGWLRIIKIDKETGKVIPAAGVTFKMEDSAGELVVLTDRTPTPVRVSEFTTDGGGYVYLPERLKHGTYYIIEMQAPDGYVLNTNKQKVEIRSDAEEVVIDEETGFEWGYITQKFANERIKGKVTVEKTGEMLSTITTTSGKYGTVYTPVYKNQPLAGVVFEVYAAEDIYLPHQAQTPENLLVGKDELVDTITTDSDGKATSIELELGCYYLVEVDTADGYVLLDEPVYFVLESEGQLVPVVTTKVPLTNLKQKAAVEFDKEMEFQSGKETVSYEGVVFGVFANEALYATDNTSIPKDGLIELVVPNKDGDCVISTDLPYGKYYIKELETAKFYRLDDSKYEFEFQFSNNTQSTIQIVLNKDKPIMNETEKGKTYVLKVNESNKFLEGAEFALYTEDDVYITTLVTGNNGKTKTVELSRGQKYYWVETKTVSGYKLDQTKHYFEFKEDGEVLEIKVTNYMDIVKTGDTNSLSLWMALTLASVALVTGGGMLRKKRKEEDVLS